MLHTSLGEVSMRVTADIDQQTYETVRQRARVENTSMSALLGDLVRKSLEAQPIQVVKSGRFVVFAGTPDAPKVSSESIQKVIDADGFL
jgi:hypothetical protein